jgi:hypothetical protein
MNKDHKVLVVQQDRLDRQVQQDQLVPQAQQV